MPPETLRKVTSLPSLSCLSSPSLCVTWQFYPTKFLHSHEIGSKDYGVLNTLFGLPETSLVADVIGFFDAQPEFTVLESGLGVQKGSTFLSYEAIYNDIRKAVDNVHDKVRGRLPCLFVIMVD